MYNEDKMSRYILDEIVDDVYEDEIEISSTSNSRINIILKIKTFFDNIMTKLKNIKFKKNNKVNIDDVVSSKYINDDIDKYMLDDDVREIEFDLDEDELSKTKVFRFNDTDIVLFNDDSKHNNLDDTFIISRDKINFENLGEKNINKKRFIFKKKEKKVNNIYDQENE